MTLPLVSVVITNYNYERYVGEAIDSALAQTYSRVEVVVVDDGSLDESRSVLETYKDRISTVIRENGGMAASTNSGFDKSHGDIVIFLDADDVLLPTAVERIVSAFDDPAVAKVHWPLHEIDFKGRRTGAIVPSRPLPRGDLRDAMIKDGPMEGNGPPTSGNAWPRWLLEKLLPIPEARLKQHADAYLNTLAPLQGPVRSIDEPQALYRVHDSNDYASKPLLSRLYRNQEMFGLRSKLMSEHLSVLGTSLDTREWQRPEAPYYGNLCRRVRTLELISALVPAGGKFLLVDHGAFGRGPLLSSREFARLHSYLSASAPRPDIGRTLAEIEENRKTGASFAIFTKPALWRIRHDNDLRLRLGELYARGEIEELIIYFDLRRQGDSTPYT